jgi:hypothetical protein
MAHKQTRPWSHPEFRHRSQSPLPAVDDVEHRLLDVLSPSLLAPASSSGAIHGSLSGGSACGNGS